MAEAGLALGISAVMGVLWWLISMMTFTPNTTYLQTSAGIAQEPFLWMWGNLGSSTHGWTAATYLATFIVYAGVSVIELFGWSFWAIDNPGSDCFYKFYVSYVGYWFALYGGILTWIFPLLQLILPNTGGLGPGLGGLITAEYGLNSLYLMVANGIMWIVTSLLHIVYVPELKNEILGCKAEGGDRKSEEKEEVSKKDDKIDTFKSEIEGINMKDIEEIGEWDSA